MEKEFVARGSKSAYYNDSSACELVAEFYCHFMSLTELTNICSCCRCSMCEILFKTVSTWLIMKAELTKRDQ